MADYQAMGLKVGWEPTSPNHLIMFLAAAPGSGKTTFVASNPGCWILDAEGRAGDVVHSQCGRFHFNDFQDYIGLIAALEADGKAGKHPCSTIAIDSVDVFIDLMVPYLSEAKNQGADIRDMARGKGWYMIRDLMSAITRRLYTAGYGVCLLAHLKETDITNADGAVIGIRRSPNLPPSVTSALFTLCHIQTSMLRKTVVPKVTKYVKAGNKEVAIERDGDPETRFYLNMKPGDNGLGDAKNPYLGYLDEIIEVPAQGGWDHFMGAYNKALDQIREQKAGGTNG